MPPDPTLIDRLLAKRSIEGDCWIFTGARARRARSGGGYGLIQAWGKLRLVHRVAAALWLAFDIESAEHILHQCDTPACFNPEHLFVGSNLDNARDRRQKGRYARGAANPAAKLNTEQVATVREALARGDTKAEIGRRFGVSRAAIGAIASGRNWADL